MNATSNQIKQANMENKQLQQVNIETFVKENLCGRFFVGSYQERRYVEPIKSYRCRNVKVQNIEIDYVNISMW